MSNLKLVGLAIYSALSMSSVAAAQNTNDMAAALERQQRAASPDLDPSLIVINRRQPIAFRPFEMIDVVTGRPIPADSTLTLPDGKQVQAGLYFEKLNEIERGLNEIGYSLRQDWTSVVIQRSAVNTDALEVQARRARAATNTARPFSVRSFAEFNREAMVAQNASNDIAVTRAPVRIPALPPPTRVEVVQRPSSAGSRAIEQSKASLPEPKKPVLVSTTNEYPFELGDPKLFAASVNGKLDLAGSEDNMRLTGGARAGISIFGISSDVARLGGFMNAPKKGNMTGNVTLDVLPFGTIYNLSLDGASISKEDNITRGVDVPFASFRVMIGPVPVLVKAGARGNVGVRYYAGLNPASAVAEFAPIVRSSLYVQAGVDIIVAGAGAGAEMTLVNYDLSMYGALRLWTQIPDGGTKPALGIREQYQIAHKLQMLSGSAYAYAYIYVPTCCIPPWTKKEWRWEMFNWAGFTPVDGNLADVTRWTSLGVPTK